MTPSIHYSPERKQFWYAILDLDETPLLVSPAIYDHPESAAQAAMDSIKHLERVVIANESKYR